MNLTRKMFRNTIDNNILETIQFLSLNVTTPIGKCENKIPKTEWKYLISLFNIVFIIMQTIYYENI